MASLGGEGHVRWEAQRRTTPKISKYFKSINISLVTDIVQDKVIHLLLPLKKKVNNFPRIVYGKAKGAVWVTCLHDT